MLAERVVRSPYVGMKLRSAVVGIMAVAVTVLTTAMSPALVSSAQAQGQTNAALTPPPAFDVADVHVSPYDKDPFMNGGILNGDRYILRQATMTQIIAAAYHVDSANVQGGPSWLDWDHFDIYAKAPPTTSKATIQLMLQSLLAERFHLVVHIGSAPMPAYVLTAPDGKSKMKESDGTGDPSCMGQPPPANQAPGTVPPIFIICHNETMEQFNEFLRNIENAAVGDTTKPVVDSTGLKGAYDFELKWTPPATLSQAGADGISFFDAVDKELGLKFTLGTAPLPVLAVDSVDETPTPNVPDLAKRMPPLPPPHVEVATVKPSKPDEQRKGRIQGDQMNLQAWSLKDVMVTAWDLNPADNEAIAGEPKWLDVDRFDIVAKLADDDSPGAAPKAPQILYEELQQILRGLIEDRFQMKVHMEDRPVSAYNLVADNPKLTKADPKTRTQCHVVQGPDPTNPKADPILDRHLMCQNITMAQFAILPQSIIVGYIHSALLDETGLKGSYNFTVNFSGSAHFAPGAGGELTPDGAPQTSDPNGAVNFFDAMKSQLGLKLEKVKRPVPVLVIDHIDEQPTAN